MLPVKQMLTVAHILMQGCPVKVDFRKEQCAKFNNKTVTWIPVQSDRMFSCVYILVFTTRQDFLMHERFCFEL